MPKMKTVKVEYSVRFRTLVNVPSDVPASEISSCDEVGDIDIPENHDNLYVPDSFEVTFAEDVTEEDLRTGI